METDKAGKEKTNALDGMIVRCVEDLVCFSDFPVTPVLNLLLKDKSTGRNIIWATSSYLVENGGFAPAKEIDRYNVTGFFRTLIQPRVCRTAREQSHRTRTKAEVFTPGWVCAKMNAMVDEAFRDLPWREYVRARCLEITCGEAPFLVSRYDAVTGEIIPAERRFGLLDRKLQKVNEHATTEKEWLLWTRRAFESTYGYEYQGDNLLIARVNLLNTFCDYLGFRWNRRATIGEIKTIANIIVWNIWQMDGLSGRLPDPLHRFSAAKGKTEQQLELFGKEEETSRNFVETSMPSSRGAACGAVAICESGAECRQNGQLTVLRHGSGGLGEIPGRGDCFATLAMTDRTSIKTPQNSAKIREEVEEDGFCKIYDWQSRRSVLFNDIKKESAKMKFSFVIGNPPYQDETTGDNKTKAPPVYHLFLEGAYQVADKVEMIHPARFLFNGKSTPKAWNEKMLSDEHLKILYYNSDSASIFPGKDIKGGVVITYRSGNDTFEPIGTFVAFDELRSIRDKVVKKMEVSLATIIYSSEVYNFTDVLHKEHPNVEALLSDGHKYDLKSNVIDKLDGEIFFSHLPDKKKEHVQVLGLRDKKRVYRWIDARHLTTPENFRKYKVAITEANGDGSLEFVFSSPLILGPEIGHTQTFMTIGDFEEKCFAEYLLKYLKGKFCRVMLSILKVTQHNPIGVWKYVPLQDFTSQSDIDWSKSIAEIDQQLYKKYALTAKEIEFIESHVKEMA